MKIKLIYVIMGLILLNMYLVNAETVEIAANDKITIDDQTYFTIENIEGISGEDWLVKNASGKKLATYEDINIGEGISYKNVLLSEFNVISEEFSKSGKQSIRLEKKTIEDLKDREVIINKDIAFNCDNESLITLGVYDHHIYKKSFSFSILNEKSYPSNKNNEYYEYHAGTAYLKEDDTYLLNFGGEATYGPEEKGGKLQELCGPYLVFVNKLTENSAKLIFEGCNNDGKCDEDYGENSNFCRNDCSVARCGDRICSSNEKENCPIDCDTTKFDEGKKTESDTRTSSNKNIGNEDAESNIFIKFINWIKNLFS